MHILVAFRIARVSFTHHFNWRMSRHFSASLLYGGFFTFFFFSFILCFRCIPWYFDILVCTKPHYVNVNFNTDIYLSFNHRSLFYRDHLFILFILSIRWCCNFKKFSKFSEHIKHSTHLFWWFQYQLERGLELLINSIIEQRVAYL